MAELVNLKQARKARDRVAAEALAAQNRARHGRSKAQKLADRKAEELARKHIDGAKLTP